MNKIFNSIVSGITRFKFTHTIYFSIIYTLAIFLNGWKGFNFDTNAILLGYGVIAGKSLVGYTIDSKMNSDRGVMPVKNDNMPTTTQTISTNTSTSIKMTNLEK